MRRRPDAEDRRPVPTHRCEAPARGGRRRARHHRTPAEAGAGRAGRREWAGPALPTLLVSIDALLLLPGLSADLGAGSTEQLRSVDVHAFMLAGS
ncbi:hypothetical protein RKD24_000115 [Streptomyces calvus]